MLVPWAALNSRHPNTSQCDMGEDIMQLRLALEDAIEVMERSFRKYYRMITNMVVFKYRGCILMATENTWTVVVADLWKSQKKWERISRILIQEGAN